VAAPRRERASSTEPDRSRPNPGRDETERELPIHEPTRTYEQLETANPIEGNGMKLLMPRP
jgi:hypothetical protein